MLFCFGKIILWQSCSSSSLLLQRACSYKSKVDLCHSFNRFIIKIPIWMFAAPLHWWLRWQRACNVGDLGSIPRSGRPPGEGNGNALQYSCLKNPKDKRGLAGYSPWGHKELNMTEWHSMLYNVIKILSLILLVFTFSLGYRCYSVLWPLGLQHFREGVSPRRYTVWGRGRFSGIRGEVILFTGNTGNSCWGIVFRKRF